MFWRLRAVSGGDGCGEKPNGLAISRKPDAPCEESLTDLMVRQDIVARAVLARRLPGGREHGAAEAVAIATRSAAYSAVLDNKSSAIPVD
jgi:hypothetical protein